MKPGLIAFVLGMAVFTFARADTPAEFVATNAVWRYFKGTQEASSPDRGAWRAAGFADAAWLQGAAPFSYGEAGITTGTQLPDMQQTGTQAGYASVFLRRTFTVGKPAEVAELTLSTVCDDGFIAWINGQEVARYSGPVGEPLFNSLSTTNAAEPVGFLDFAVEDPAARLKAGENVLAIQVFNVSLTSSDLVFDAGLSGLLRAGGPPTVADVSPEPGMVTSLREITVTFSEPVIGVAAEHFLVNEVPATGVSGSGQTYTFTFPQPLYGPVLVRWSTFNTIMDLETPPQRFELASPGANWTYELLDPEGPAVAVVQPAADLTLRRFSQVEVTFDKAVVGVEAPDLLVNGVAATSVTGIGAGPYLFEFPAVTSGEAKLEWAPAHGITSDSPVPHPFAGEGWSYVVDGQGALGPLQITEFMAENYTSYRDEDADPEDWIEIYNPGSQAVNLLGWSLSNEQDQPGKWVFPAVSLPANSYLVVFASAKDRTTAGAGARLHTNFKLNPNGGWIGLCGPELPRTAVSSVAYPAQGPDHSFGREYGTGAWRYFKSGTPGAKNAASTIASAVEDVHFSVKRGFFSQPFSLSLACPTPGAFIQYTTNGSPPMETNGFRYSQPIAVTANQIIRAAAFKTNALPSHVGTHTYLLATNATQLGWLRLPALSLVTASNNLYGRTGIMEYSPRNTIYRGPQWERPVSAEWIEPADNSGFQVDCGIRVQGGDYVRGQLNYKSGSLPFNKYSFRLYFRGEYGQGRLNVPLFPDTTQTSFDTIVLRAGMNDHSNPFITDEVVRGLARDVGQPAAVGTFVHLFLNGVYKGYYNPTERIDVDFLRAYHGGGERWDVIAQMGEVREGDATAWNNLRTFATTKNLTNSANYLQLARQLDLTNFVDYLCPLIYVDNDDWPHNNWRAARERVAGGLFRFYVWDSEWAFGLMNGHAPSWNTIANQLSATSPPWGSAEIATLFNALKKIPEFQLLFADRVHRHFFNGGALTDERIKWRYETIRARMNNRVSGFNNRAGATWIPQRRKYQLDQFYKAGFLASSNAPAFNQLGGRVSSGFALVMTNLTGAMYFTTNGADPRVMFTGAVSPAAQAYDPAHPPQLDQDVTVRARALAGTNWSALSEASFQVEDLGLPLRITEIMYNPPGGDAYEFLELANTGGVAVDISGFSFEGIDLRFAEPFPVVQPGARLVLANGADRAAFAARYPGVTVAAWYAGALSNGGERLALLDRKGLVVTSVEYDDAGAWPKSADGDGYSLELTDVDGDPDDPANWHASAGKGGTPGAPNAIPALPTVRINEIRATGAAGESDWVELYNAGTTAASLANWTFSGSGTNSLMFPANVTLAPKAYLRLWCDALGTPAGELHTGFGLKRTGETLLLASASGQRMDAVTFGPQVEGYTLGRLGAGGDWALTEPTPKGPNEAALLAPAADLCVNEFMANPPVGADDWIELHNRSTGLPLALQGLWLGTSNALQRIGALAFVPPGGFVVLKADGQVGPDHLDFKLPATGGAVILYAADGTELQRLNYTNAVEGSSLGLLPDGTGAYTQFPDLGSPGASNHLGSTSPLVLNEVMARADRVPLAAAGRVVNWIELANTNAAAVSLAGYSLNVGKRQPGGWVFPAGSSIAANGFTVLLCDADEAASTTAGSLMNTALALGAAGDEVYLFDPQGQLVDAVEFGFQVADVSIGRREGAWQLLAAPTPRAANGGASALGSPLNVRLNEWLADSPGDDWIEVYNPEPAPVDLGNLRLTDDPSIAGRTNHIVRPLTFIAAGGWVVWVADGKVDKGPEHLPFSLDGAGETLRIYAADNTLIDSVDLLTQQLNVSEGRFPDGGTNVMRFPNSSSPGSANFLPLPDLVINEVLTHTDPPLEDAIELYNAGAQPIDIGGWYLSNSLDRWTKYRLPAGTRVPARGYLVLYEGAFNAASQGEDAFTLNSAHGDQVYLSQADSAGRFAGYRAGRAFEAAQNGVSFGRHVTSAGVEFVPMNERTFGQDSPASVEQFRQGHGLPNGLPRVGPAVISEIMYQPSAVNESGLVELPEEEYLELRNLQATTLPLYDVEHPTNRWKLAGGVDFVFPAGANLPASGYGLVVGFNPATNAVALAAFQAKYKVPVGVPIFGPYEGRLSNEGEAVALYKPDPPQLPPHPDAGFVPYVLVERVAYSPVPPWPLGTTGTGMSLQRVNVTSFGNEPLNWRASRATAGRAIPAADADSDNDGLPDDWELANALDPDVATGNDGAAGDPDNDGLSNLREHQLGLNPQALTVVILDSRADGGKLYFKFNAALGRSYRLDSRPAVDGGAWTVVTNILPTQTGDLEFAIVPPAEGASFYRIVTLAVP